MNTTNKLIIAAFLLFAFVVLIGSLQTVSHTAATPAATNSVPLQQTNTVPTTIVSPTPTLMPTPTHIPTQTFIPLQRPQVQGGGDD